MDLPKLSDLTDTERALVDAAERDDQAEVARLTELIDAEQGAATARLAEPIALTRAALWYAAAGLAVFPCVPGGKTPLTRHGFLDASTDEQQVRRWWTQWPAANVALPTGRAFDVFDIDGPAGLLAVGEVADAGGFPVILAQVLTPRGRHYYVPVSGHGNKAGVLEQVDYRGAGGYVIAPPSRTPDGGYRWVRGHELDVARLTV